jgi:hypothetical protein
MVEIKARPNLVQTAQSVLPKLDLGGIPDVSLADVQRCLKRSHHAQKAHDDILKRVGDGQAKLSKRDIEGMLSRAGVETTDVKTVLAYHAKQSTSAFSSEALTFMKGLDWSDVADAHVDELKRQNKEQVEGHRDFIKTDRAEFQEQRKDDRQKLEKVSTEKARLQEKTPLQIEAEFAEETTNTGLNGKEAFLLLAHRKRFANND